MVIMDFPNYKVKGKTFIFELKNFWSVGFFTTLSQTVFSGIVQVSQDPSDSSNNRFY